MPRVPGLDKEISRIVLGTMVVNIDRKAQSFALLDAAYENGITTFDTASAYGSESCLGAWCAERGLHDKVVIIDKGCHPDANGSRVTPAALAEDLEQALDKLQTDCIDIYLLHRDDMSLPVAPIVEAFNEHHAAGRIKAFGGSNWTYERLREAVSYAEEHDLVPFTASSPNYGLAEQVEDPWGPGCVTLTGPLKAEARKWHVETQLAVFAYSSLARGLFSGRVARDNYEETADSACRKAYCHEVNFARLDRASELAVRRGVTVTQIALAFVLNSPMNMHALVGAETREECEQCVEACSIRLSATEMDWLLEGE
jgi:aryl-alcohol dehydrogenase-like predicted oxidoreductase